MAIMNWKTTLSGLIGALVVVGAEVQKFLDNDVATQPDWNVVIGAVVLAIGLFFARDADKSSKATGVK
tara:strand:+ start:11223 stop:11426 length:204 start_codon:yes stop_codon:yes gene_type:complete